MRCLTDDRCRFISKVAYETINRGDELVSALSRLYLLVGINRLQELGTSNIKQC